MLVARDMDHLGCCPLAIRIRIRYDMDDQRDWEGARTLELFVGERHVSTLVRAGTQSQ